MKNIDTPRKIPNTHPTLRVIPMPADTNAYAYGDIFGGWLLSQMDLAGASAATKLVKNRVVTVGIDGMNFHKPVFVGDEVSFYTNIQRTGRTSIAVHIEAWARARDKDETRMVTEGIFTFVAIDENRQPIEVKKMISRYLFLFVIIFSFYAQAEELKPLPKAQTLTIEMFDEKSKLIDKTFDDKESLNFSMKIPSNFIVKSDEQLKANSKNHNVEGELFHAYGPTIYDLRPYISFKSFGLNRLISAPNWFLSNSLENGYTVRGIEKGENSEKFEAFYVRLDDFGREEVVRSKGFLHRGQIVAIEYAVPVKFFEQQIDYQIHSIQSFEFMNDYKIMSPERIVDYEFLESFSVKYPQSWLLTKRSDAEVNRHNVTFKTSDERGFLIATIDVSVVSRRSLKDRMDKAIYPVNLGNLIKDKKENLSEEGYEAGISWRLKNMMILVTQQKLP